MQPAFEDLLLPRNRGRGQTFTLDLDDFQLWELAPTDSGSGGAGGAAGSAGAAGFAGAL